MTVAGTGRTTVARPNQRAAFAEAPGLGWSEAVPDTGADTGADTGEASLLARKAVLREDCEALFLQLREVDADQAVALRAALEQAHRDLIALVHQVANRPWDGMALAEQQAEIGRGEREPRAVDQQERREVIRSPASREEQELHAPMHRLAQSEGSHA